MNNLSNLSILYEDEFILIVFKAAGVLSQKDIKESISLNDLVKEYLRKTYKSDYVALLHRLDRPVSGPLIFAKTKRAADLMSKQFRDGKIRKKYYALVFGLPCDTKDLENYIFNTKNGVLISDKDAGGYKKAKLSFERVKYYEDKNVFLGGLTLLDIILVTGRKHQIRSQLAYFGHPILGDLKYFNIRSNFSSEEINLMLKASKLPRGEIALCSYSISFKHPLKHGKLIEINLDVPKNWGLNKAI